MSFASLFNGGAARRGSSPQRPSGRSSNSQPPVSETEEGRIGMRLERYTAQANDGLETAFVPEELGSMFVTARQVPFEAIERERPL